MSDENIAIQNNEVIKNAIQKNLPIAIKTYTLPKKMENYMNQVLTLFLHELNLDYLTDYLTYCLKELLTNSKKANTKRVFFQTKNLNIQDEKDYRLGISSFKEETTSNINHYLLLQKQAGLFIKLVLQFKNNILRFEIQNNCELTTFEYNRIQDKLKKALEYSSVTDATIETDNTEGAGLGLIIISLMLQKLGIGIDCFQVLSGNGETKIRIMLPLKKIEQHQILALSTEISNAINAIPQFPENINRINQLLNNPESKITDIVMHISNDVTLTTDLLRMVNKASFRLAEPCTNVAAAVKMVGLRTIKNLLYTIGTIQNLTTTENSKKELWNHASKVASYSYILSYRFCSTEHNIVSDAYVCGLLHDIGKILFEAAHPDTINQFKNICTQKGLPDIVFEKITAGANHGEIGALITKNWNFPDVITSTIQFHHSPFSAPKEHRKIVQLVYLANMLTHYEQENIKYEDIDSKVLQEFHLDKLDSFEKLSLELKILNNKN